MLKHFKALLGGEISATSLDKPEWRCFATYFLAVVIGSSVYGATIGLWRAPLQALFTAIKFPLLIFATCIGNGVVNGMLAQVLGSSLTFRQTALAILMSFAIASVILGGFSPIALFVVYNAPPLGSEHAIVGHSVMLLTHVFGIAFAGVIANRRLLGWLRKISRHDRTAHAVLFSWVAGNLFLGAQLAWNLRPFIGAPQLAVQFLRDDALRGNFYEAVWRAFRHVFL
jgi:hypothetical protein